MRWYVPGSVFLLFLPLSSKYSSNIQDLSQLFSAPLPPSLFTLDSWVRGHGGLTSSAPPHDCVLLSLEKLQCGEETEGM